MKYQVQCQLIPGNSQIWVAHLNPQDPIYEYESEFQALEKAEALERSDDTGRKYRVSRLSNT